MEIARPAGRGRRWCDVHDCLKFIEISLGEEYRCVKTLQPHCLPEHTPIEDRPQREQDWLAHMEMTVRRARVEG